MLKQDRKHRVHEYLIPQILWNSSLLIMLFFFNLGVRKNVVPGLFTLMVNNACSELFHTDVEFSWFIDFGKII